MKSSDTNFEETFQVLL